MGHIEQTIEELDRQILLKQKELEGLQIAVNNLCSLIGREPAYEISPIGQGPKQKQFRLKSLRGDEYFGRALATVITEILQERKEAGLGPATTDDIQTRMLEGGYNFEDREPLRAIGVSMGKNQKFTKLPNDKWGLTEWYPDAKEKKTVIKVPLEEAEQYATTTEDEQPTEESETPVIVEALEQSEKSKKRGRPPKKKEATSL
jgi:DNA-directed RNA polymerase delta subunit